MQQNNKNKLCADRYETVYHLISESNKLAQTEYNTMYDWLGKMIHWEWCKRL